VTRSTKRSVLIAILVLAFVLPLVLAASASAYPGFNSMSETQIGPGQTLRQVWGSAQLYTYKLPYNVTHQGYIHVEMNYTWAGGDCYIYLVDQYGEICEQSDGYTTEPEGYNGDWNAKEVLDFYVDHVDNTAVNAAGDDLVGDVYYVLVQPWADWHEFSITGYYPRVAFDPGNLPGNTIDGTYNWFRGKFTYPKTGKTAIYSAPYGYGFDFTPTSQGKGYMNTRYPFNPKTKQPLPEYTDPTMQAASMDQYLYESGWSENGALWDMANTSGAAHWIQNHTQGGTPPFMAPDASWTRRISAGFDVKNDTAKPPNKVLHYVPCVWEVALDPSLGPDGGLKVGMSTVGFLGSILYPQNCWLDKTKVKLQSGKVKLAGNLAIAPFWNDPAGSSTLGWAPDGTVLTIQAKVNGTWKKVGNGMVNGDAGAWYASVTAKPGTYAYRAYWRGDAMESITVQTRAKNVPDGAGFKWSAWKTVVVKAADQPLYPDGSYDLFSSTLSPTAGLGLQSYADLVGGALLSTTIKAGDPTLTITFDNKPTQPVEVKFVSTDNWDENSLSKSVTK
jgi:hypothetical protein